MEFFDEAVRVLETIVKAMQGRFADTCPPLACGRQGMAAKCPEFTKHMVRVKKHIRPPVRAGPEIYPKVASILQRKLYGQPKRIETTEYGTYQPDTELLGKKTRNRMGF